MSKKAKLIVIVSILILVAAAVFLAATDPFEIWSTPLVEDTNVQMIKINSTIKQGDITYTITKLEAGDKYTTIYYEMSEPIMGEILKGAKLLQNGVALDYIIAPESKKRGNAICFEHIDNLDNLTLSIADIVDFKINTYDYELNFIDNYAEATCVIDGQSYNIEVVMNDHGMNVVAKDIYSYEKDNKSTSVTIPKEILFYNESTDLSKPYLFNALNLPTHIRIVDKIYILGSQDIEIPIS